MTQAITDGAAVWQMNSGAPYPNEACQPTIGRAMGLRFGFNWAVAAICATFPNDCEFGSAVPALVNYLNSHGIPCHRVQTDLATRVNGAISRRHVCHSLITSDIHGNPIPNITPNAVGHFLENVSTYPWRTMNPAYGQFITYPNLLASDAYDGLEVDIVAPADEQGEDMGLDQTSVIASAMVRMWQREGKLVGMANYQPNAEPELAQAILVGDGATALAIANAVVLPDAGRAGVVSSMNVRMWQRQGWQIGTAVEPNAEPDLAKAIVDGDGQTALNIVNGAKFGAS